MFKRGQAGDTVQLANYEHYRGKNKHIFIIYDKYVLYLFIIITRHHKFLLYTSLWKEEVVYGL